MDPSRSRRGQGTATGIRAIPTRRSATSTAMTYGRRLSWEPCSVSSASSRCRGCQGRTPAARRRSRTVLPWSSASLDARDYQWNEVAIPYWKDIQARASDADVKVWIQMHPHNLVYDPAPMERLATEINATHVGAEMDPSHLFWQGIDPVEAVNSLGGSRWPENSSWDLVAVGRGHDVAWWTTSYPRWRRSIPTWRSTSSTRIKSSTRWRACAAPPTPCCRAPAGPEWALA